MTSLHDEPALADETTARLFAHLVERQRSGLWGLVFVPVYVVAGVWLMLVVPDLGVFAVGAALTGIWQAATAFVSGVSRWPRAARRLLTEEPWRPSQATVLDVRGTVLRLADGTHVRVFGLPAPVREVVVRAGQVSLVGPDAAGWLAVRVDGLHTPWPARTVRALDAGPATPSATPVTVAWVDRLVTRATVDLAALAVVSVAVVVLAVLPGHDDWVLPGVVGAAAVVVVQAWRRLRAARLLRHEGPWQKASATTLEWKSGRDGTGAGRMELRFPDGRRRVAEIEKAPLDLFANAWREETLWVADRDVLGFPSRPDVVGFPDYPVVASARLTAPAD